MTVVAFDPLRDKSYRQTALGRDVADFLAWKELGGASPRTLDDYERYLARGAIMFPATPLTAWTDAEVLHVAKAMPQRSRRVRMAAYSSFFRWAKQQRRISDNPMDYVPRIKRQQQKIIDVFSEDEVDALLALPTRDAAPLAVLLEAGLRKTEARNLLWRNSSLKRRRVTVKNGKGGKDREIPMSARLAQLLAQLALDEDLKPEDHILYSERAGGWAAGYWRKTYRNSPQGSGTFARWWRRCLEEAGVRYRNPHTARHTFATTWRNRGLAADDLQILLGHASIQTTVDLYFHTSVEDVAARMALIEEAE